MANRKKRYVRKHAAASNMSYQAALQAVGEDVHRSFHAPGHSLTTRDGVTTSYGTTTFSVRCGRCTRWIHCGDTPHTSACYCGRKYRVIFVDERDWSLAQNPRCLDCGVEARATVRSEGRNPWHLVNEWQERCNRCHLTRHEPPVISQGLELATTPLSEPFRQADALVGVGASIAYAAEALSGAGMLGTGHVGYAHAAMTNTMAIVSAASGLGAGLRSGADLATPSVAAMSAMGSLGTEFVPPGVAAISAGLSHYLDKAGSAQEAAAIATRMHEPLMTMVSAASSLATGMRLVADLAAPSVAAMSAMGSLGTEFVPPGVAAISAGLSHYLDKGGSAQEAAAIATGMHGSSMMVSAASCLATGMLSATQRSAMLDAPAQEPPRASNSRPRRRTGATG